MSYIFWKLLFQRLILAINKSFLSILRGVRFLLTLRLNIISLKKRIIGLKSEFYKQLFWDRKKVFFLNKKNIHFTTHGEHFCWDLGCPKTSPGGWKGPRWCCGIQVCPLSKGLWYPGGIFVVSNWYLLLLSQPSNHHYSVNGHLEANDPWNDSKS